LLTYSTRPADLQGFAIGASNFAKDAATEADMRAKASSE
jgi:hypothetical protein